MSKLEPMRRAAQAAGKYMLTSQDRQHTQKSGIKDFVTEADLKCQEIIRVALAEAFPGVIMLSEEGPEAERAALYQPDFTGFVVDPIDGTYNFKRDMHESVVSIGYVERGEEQAGVIYDPYKDELFTTEKGKGAFRNGQLIHVSDRDDLADASIFFCNSYSDQTMVNNMRRHLAIYEETGIMPWSGCSGSSVMVMAGLACGRLEGYHNPALKPWDNAAAFLLIREAGGVIEPLSGEGIVRFITPGVIAGTPAIVKELQRIFAKLPTELLT